MTDNSDNSTRLNKYLANNTDFARRKIDEFILQGRVTVNNKVVLEQGLQITPGKDDIKLDGERIKAKSNKLYFILHKPIGFITTTDDEKNRKTVIDLIKTRDKVFPIGRLDAETSGVLLLTNDGDFANKLMHPRFKVEKTYIVTLSKPLEEKIRAKLSGGIKLDGKKTAPAKIAYPNKNDLSVVSVTLTEGRNRQVRRMTAAIGFPTLRLIRYSIGNWNIDNISQGEYKILNSL